MAAGSQAAVPVHDEVPLKCAEFSHPKGCLCGCFECADCGWRHLPTEACPVRDYKDPRKSLVEVEQLLTEGLQRKDSVSFKVPEKYAKVRNCPGDGDCLYWSVNADLGEYNDATLTRSLAVQWLWDACDRNDDLGKKFRDAIFAETKESPDRYCIRMARPLRTNGKKTSKYWGGPVELAAWATITRREVWVWAYLKETQEYQRTQVFRPIDNREVTEEPLSVLFSTAHYDFITFPQLCFDEEAFWESKPAKVPACSA
eukprot:gnl/TRDRNA2_/TRDRNA2_176170_c6_seq1.p1 gnl/TRDRNA2_/TRDRNA2_176170_c6~~gnl/TRDRNA2_/TRDRNA2_176170_c6_seq1.p1  ORF type:complete len:257 (+),score=28.71 gnl/TRDRNA2_/TRDRNA2_176170_c6_seq1:394-1164(+)